MGAKLDAGAVVGRIESLVHALNNIEPVKCCEVLSLVVVLKIVLKIRIPIFMTSGCQCVAEVQRRKVCISISSRCPGAMT